MPHGRVPGEDWRELGVRCRGKCLRGSLDVLLLDQLRHTAFLYANVDSGQNSIWVLFRLNLESGELTRPGRSFGGTFRDTAMSPDGRYLSYMISSNDSGGEGHVNLFLVDLRTGVEISPVERLWKDLRSPEKPILDRLVDVQSFIWRDASTIAFTAETRERIKDMDEERPRGAVRRYHYHVGKDQLTMTGRNPLVIP